MGHATYAGRWGRVCNPHSWDHRGFCVTCKRWKIGTSQRAALNVLRKVQMGPGCWQWIGCVNPLTRRPQCSWRGISEHATIALWEIFNGKRPKGLVLDHLCKEGQCVNPFHLELVTQRENLRRNRKAFCKRQHPQTAENRQRFPNGQERCRLCKRDWQIERRILRQSE